MDQSRNLFPLGLWSLGFFGAFGWRATQAFLTMSVSQSCSCKSQAQAVQVDQESQGSVGSLGVERLGYHGTSSDLLWGCRVLDRVDFSQCTGTRDVGTSLPAPPALSASPSAPSPPLPL